MLLCGSLDVKRQAAWTADIDYPRHENIDWRDAWNEAEHPRGQPKNAGQWVEGGKAGPAAEAAKAKAGGSKEVAGSKQEASGGSKPSRSRGSANPEQEARIAAAKTSKTPASTLMPEIKEYGPHEIAAIAVRLSRKANAEAEIDWAHDQMKAHGLDKNSKQANVTPDGEYTPERKLKHEEILNKLFNAEAIARATPAPGVPPMVTFLGGRGGSGKSSLQSDKGGPVDVEHAIVIDADHFKSALPEFEGWNAYEVHQESGDLVDEAEKWARRYGVNVVHDATLKSASTVNRQIAEYQAQGYDTAGHYMHTMPEVAAQRSMERYANGIRKDGKGRYVAPEIILANTHNERNFDDLIPRFTRGWSLWDNNGDAPVRVAGSDDNDEQSTKARDRAAWRRRA